MSRESGQHFTCTIQISLDLTEPEALADFLRRGSASASGSMDCIGKFKFNRTGRIILPAVVALATAKSSANPALPHFRANREAACDSHG